MDQFIAGAQSEIGKPYVYGDEGPNSFDCSGLVQYCLGLVGIKAPRTAAQQQSWAQPITSPRPGDLVFWGRPAEHVGIYIGGGKMIAAPHTGARVQVQAVYGSPTYGRVPGLAGSIAVAPVVDAVTGAAQTVSTTAADWLGGARYTALEVVIVLAGLSLVGVGVVHTVRARSK